MHKIIKFQINPSEETKSKLMRSKLRIIKPSQEEPLTYYFDHNYANKTNDKIINDIPSDDFYHTLNQEFIKELIKTLSKRRHKYIGKYERKKSR